jgi:hypothetical protein
VCRPEHTVPVHVSYVATANAAGDFVLPYFIIAGKNVRGKHAEGWPDARYFYTPNGSMDTEAYADWCEQFVKETATTPDNPCILLMDNHSSHHTVDGLTTLVKSGVKVLYFPPFSTHILCPLDVGYFRGFKENLATAARENFMSRQSLRVEDIISCSFPAHIRSATIMLTPGYGKNVRNKESPIINGFKKSGIFPFDPSQTAEYIVPDVFEDDADGAHEPQPELDMSKEAIQARLEDAMSQFKGIVGGWYAQKKHRGGRVSLEGSEMLAKMVAVEERKAEKERSRAPDGVKRGPGRPKGSKNKKKPQEVVRVQDGSDEEGGGSDSESVEILPVSNRKRAREEAAAPVQPAAKRRKGK